MSNLWLETFLGKVGKYIIMFVNGDVKYFSSIPTMLILVTLIYGIFLAIASCNLKRIEKRVIREIIRQAKVIIDNNPGINYVNLINKIVIDWQELIKKYSFFPLISQESGLWVNKTNVVNVRDNIMHDDRKMHLILDRHGIALLEDRRQVRRNLYLEYIHRINKK
ncbi:MAG: hypothetical protein L6305_07500 [Actinomycetia bacterium]|nr:hypothetical protein [Actinomycetota bacterium]MCG2791578.1 hypothetical protein [Actinomycetes bacterium]